MNLKASISKHLEWIISFIVLLPVSIGFILNPLTNDARVYSGLARITEYFGTFPQNIDLTYEVKPIGNRMMNFLIYKIDTLFTTFGTLEYETLFKIIAAVIVLVICYYFSRKINIKYSFLLLSMVFLTPLNFITLQPDWWATLFAFLALGLFLTDKSSNHYLAGAIITMIFLFKGSTLFLVLPIACALYILEPDWFKRLKYGALGSVVSLAAIVGCGLFVNLIPDMLLSARIARVGSIDGYVMLLNFVDKMTTLWAYIPAFLVGVVCTYLLYVKYMKNKNWKFALALILMFGTACISPFIQSEYFLYQYVPILFAGTIAILLLNHNAIKYSILVMFVLFITFSGYWGIGMKVERAFYGDQFGQVRDIKNALPDLTSQESILYIDSGVAPYYFPSNSSCRYVQALPFQRNNWNWTTSDTYQYKEEFDCIMNYKGKYIIEDENNWFKQNTSDMKIVWNKINKEYEKVWALNWNVYRRI